MKQKTLFIALALMLVCSVSWAQNTELKLLKESGAGMLYESNGFLIPVLKGSTKEMGAQYGALMVDEMQKVWDALVQPGRKAGKITDEQISIWADRAYTTGSTRTKQFYEGIADGSGWPLNNVIMLDQVMEFSIFQAKLHSFAGCTSIMSWGKHSTDGEMYTGRNMDWSDEFNNFATVLTVRNPTDGSYKFATTGWPGMLCAFTAINEHGVYLDVHDGTSMGGSVVYTQRPSIINILTDFISESSSLDAIVARFNGSLNSTSLILSLADENGAASMECSSLAGNRVRQPKGESYVVVNSFLDPDWGLGKRETVSNSLRRYSNMTDRLEENTGKVNAEVVRNLMDLKLFDADGNFAKNGGATKPTNQDADLTNYQTVFDIKQREVWLKIPGPNFYREWTHFDLKELWK